MYCDIKDDNDVICIIVFVKKLTQLVSLFATITSKSKRVSLIIIYEANRFDSGDNLLCEIIN